MSPRPRTMRAVHVAACMAILAMQFMLSVHGFAEEEPAPAVEPAPVEEPEPSPSGSGSGGRSRGGGAAGGGDDSSNGLDDGYKPYTFLDSLGYPTTARFCDLTPLAVNNSEYEARCGSKSDPKWPCFTHYDGSLQYTTIEPWLAPLNMTNEILVKDDKAVDFTLRNASDVFTIYYRSSYGAQLNYYDYDHETGCYSIHLRGSDRYRIWVSDDKGNDRDIDTRHYVETGKRLCTKWVHIDLSERGLFEHAQWKNDGRGI